MGAGIPLYLGADTRKVCAVEIVASGEQVKFPAPVLRARWTLCWPQFPLLVHGTNATHP